MSWCGMCHAYANPSPIEKTHGAWARIYISVPAIQVLASIVCQDQSYMQIPMEFTVAEYSQLCIQHHLTYLVS